MTEQEYQGSSGYTLEVGDPDTDNEVQFSIYDGHYDVTAYAYLGVEDRQRLIRQLQACTPPE
jgi:hypothetical protein